jgi:hypothetical protein
MDRWARVRFPIPDVDDSSVEPGTSLFYIVASIALITDVVEGIVMDKHLGYEVPDLASDPSNPQFLTVGLRVNDDNGTCGSALFATLKPPLISWLEQNCTGELETETSCVMKAVYQRMLTGMAKSIAEDDLYRFPVALRSARDIHLDVPGQSTGLDPEYNSYFGDQEKTHEEYRLIPHNVDRANQQLALLAGVAYLGQRALESAITS